MTCHELRREALWAALVVSVAVMPGVALMPEELSSYVEKDLGSRLRDKGARGAVRRNLRMSDEKAATLYYQLNRGSGQCG